MTALSARTPLHHHLRRLLIVIGLDRLTAQYLKGQYAFDRVLHGNGDIVVYDIARHSLCIRRVQFAFEVIGIESWQLARLLDLLRTLDDRNANECRGCA